MTNCSTLDNHFIAIPTVVIKQLEEAEKHGEFSYLLKSTALTVSIIKSRQARIQAGIWKISSTCYDFLRKILKTPKKNSIHKKFWPPPNFWIRPRHNVRQYKEVINHSFMMCKKWEPKLHFFYDKASWTSSWRRN